MNVPKQPSRKWKMVRDQAFAALVGWALIFMSTTGAAEDKSPEPKAASTSQQQAAAKSLAKADNSATKSERPGGPHEGIKVHGHWTITIRKEDGSVASRHEFENALVNPLQLLRLLAREASMGRWEVEVGGTPQPCGLTTATAGACSLDETTGPPTFGTLQVSRPTSGPDAGALVLTGSTQARRASQVQLVRTRLFVCATPGPPSLSCSSNAFDVLTEKDVTALNIAVQANQTIDVTVAISFVN